jgi:hypothetical protein
MSHFPRFISGLIAMTYLEIKLPKNIVSLMFDKYQRLVFSDSKMIIKKYRGNKVKYKFMCSHYANSIFYRCDEWHKDEHLHCGRCGCLLKNSIKLKKTLYGSLTNCTVYDYRRKCENLTENVSFYSNYQNRIANFWEDAF